MVFCRIIAVIISNQTRQITLNLLCSVPCCEAQQMFFWLSKRKLSIQKKLVMKMVFCRIIVVIISNLVRKITLKMLYSVPCCELQQIFFSGFPKEQIQLYMSKPSIQNKLVLEMVFCRIIVAIISNLNRKITLNLLCSVPSARFNRFFFLASEGTRSASKTFNPK